MTADMQKSGTRLTVEIEGSIDTVTAPELERSLRVHWNDITELHLNFSGVDYISSAGLRVLLLAIRHLGDAGSMIIRNANTEVKKVFEITGIEHLLRFE